MREKALRYLNRDYLLNIDLIEGINRGLCDILYADGDGVLLRMKDGGVHMVSSDTAEKTLELLEKFKPQVLVLHQMEQKSAVIEKSGYNCGNECVNAVYLKREMLPESGFDIRPLTMGYATLASSTYHMGDLEYITELIEKQILTGAFEGENLMGFMGVHDEGAMGILEVLPEYRRRGIARALESYMINRSLERGEVPYGQIFADNTASLELQKMLGMEISEKHICWMWR